MLLVTVFTSCTTVRYKPEVYKPEITAEYVIASWYGPKFHGKPTASGEPFNMYSLTCAHKEYPFGTILKVTNVSNNKEVICIVNDRGPFVEGRELDLSYASAKAIYLIKPGTGKVKLEYIDRDLRYIKKVDFPSDIGPFTVQIGSFRDFPNAMRLKKALEFKYSRVYIVKADIDGSSYYRVRIGKFNMRDDAYNIASSLAEEGYDVLIAHYEEKI